MRRALSITHSTRPTRITSQCLPVSSSPSCEGPVSPPDLLSHQLRPALPLPCPPLPSCPLARTSPPVPRLPTSPPRLPHFGPTLHMLALPHPPCYSSALLHLFLRHLICPVVTPGVPPSQCVPPSMPSGHTLHQLPVPRCDLPDAEGRLPPSTCPLQDSPELKLH